MSLRELFLWNTLYWILYLPISVFLLFLTGNGSVFGILLIGALITVILNVYLALTNEPEWESAIVHKQILDFKEIKPIPQTVGVKPYVKENKPFVSMESYPQIRTDIDLSQLNADDDDIFS